MEEKKIICLKCDREMEPGDVQLTYLKANIKYQFLRCPVCGAVYIPKDIAEGKIKKIETSLEDK